LGLLKWNIEPGICIARDHTEYRFGEDYIKKLIDKGLASQECLQRYSHLRTEPVPEGVDTSVADAIDAAQVPDDEPTEVSGVSDDEESHSADVADLEDAGSSPASGDQDLSSTLPADS
jgi:hypothetical protein